MKGDEFMLVTFEYSLYFGKGDTSESYIEMEITEKEYEMLKEAEESGEEFMDCESVKDIYDRAYELADEDATSELIAAEVLSVGTKASELYPIEIYYPYSTEE